MYPKKNSFVAKLVIHTLQSALYFEEFSVVASPLSNDLQTNCITPHVI